MSSILDHRTPYTYKWAGSLFRSRKDLIYGVVSDWITACGQYSAKVALENMPCADQAAHDMMSAEWFPPGHGITSAELVAAVREWTENHEGADA